MMDVHLRRDPLLPVSPRCPRALSFEATAEYSRRFKLLVICDLFCVDI